MKCYVVLDKKGQFIAAGYEAALEPGQLHGPEAEFEPQLRAGPDAEEGHRVIELELPAESVKMPMADLVAHLQVEAQAAAARSG